MACERCRQATDQHRELAPGYVACPDGFLTTSVERYAAVDATDDGCPHVNVPADAPSGRPLA